VQNRLVIFQPSLEHFGLLAHTWLLSVEEQFYIVWTPALVLLLRRGRTPRGILTLLVVLIAASAAEKVVLHVWDWFPKRIYNSTDTRADALLLGAASGRCADGETSPVGESNDGRDEAGVDRSLARIACPGLDGNVRYRHCGWADTPSSLSASRCQFSTS
jgi:hypothetical protein